LHCRNLLPPECIPSGHNLLQLAPARLFRRTIGTRRSQPASEFAYPCVLGEPFMASVADWAEHPTEEHRRGLEIRSFSLQPGRDCAPRRRTFHHDDTHQFLRCVRKDARHLFAGSPVRPSGGAQPSATVVSRDTHVQRLRNTDTLIQPNERAPDLRRCIKNDHADAAFRGGDEINRFARPADCAPLRSEHREAGGIGQTKARAAIQVPAAPQHGVTRLFAGARPPNPYSFFSCFSLPPRRPTARTDSHKPCIARDGGCIFG
jgi:hypothetical protein